MVINLPNPNEKQKLFLMDKHKFVAFGGARGGGKSFAIRFKAIALGLKHPGIEMLIVRRTYPELLSNHINPIKKILKVGTKEAAATYNIRDKIMTFNNGSKITFDYCNSESDINHYQGREFDIVFIDEATQMSQDQIQAIVACMRGTGDYPRRCYFTCNPGGKGHGYIKRLFIDREYMDGEYPEEYAFYQSLVYDNVALMQANPDYVRQLEALPEAKRKAWLDGDWDSFVGQVFGEFRNDPKHYKDRKWTHVIDPFDIPKSWKIIRGYDHGYTKPFSVGWFALSDDKEGRLYRIREWYGCTRQPNTGLQLTVKEIAQGIRDIEDTDPNIRGKKVYGIADPAIWGSQTGESVEDMFERCGVYNNKGDHNRLMGIMQFHYRLAFDSDGVPMFYVFNTCKEFIRTIPLLVYDDKNVEDIDTSLEDHQYDECRYVFAEHMLNPRRPEKHYTEKDPLPPDDPLDLIKAERKYN